MPTYPAGIAAELSAVIPQGFVTRGSGNSILWNEGGPSVQLESPWRYCFSMSRVTAKFTRPFQ